MLNISNKYDFLFIHIPKYAGTSIEEFFGHDYVNNEYIENKFKNLGYPKHLTLNDYELMLNNEFMEKIFKFTFIRNPFDLTVSNYNYSMKNETIYWNNRNDYEYKKNIIFSEYVKHLYNLKIQPKYNKNNRASIISFDYWIETKNNKMSFIGKFENINEDFNNLCDILNIKNDKLPYENKTSENIKYRDYYNDYTKDLIYKIFKDDLKKYNYEF